MARGCLEMLAEVLHDTVLVDQCCNLTPVTSVTTFKNWRQLGFHPKFAIDTLSFHSDAADETLFRKILSDGYHLLAPLPSEVRTPYRLRPRRHTRQLVPKVNKLCDSNFIQRMLYKESYWLSCILICVLFYL